MSPKLKKILLIGGGAVAAYLVYTKVIKKAAPAVRGGVAPSAIAAEAPGPSVSRPGMIIADTHITKIGSIEDLGLSQDLGSLGGRW